MLKHLRHFVSDSANVQALGLWVSALIAGLLAVAYAKLFRLADSAFHSLLDSNAYLAYIITPVSFLVAWFLVWRFAPAASGSGIPQILVASELEESKSAEKSAGRLLSLKTAVIKILSSLICLLGGGAIGREGPTLQVSASIFYFLSRWTKKYTSQVSEQTWIVAGAAAGLASAFNTPLGGIVYAIEELSIAHFHKIRTALLSAVIVSGLVAQWMLGSYLYLGFPQLTAIGFGFLPVAALNGAITGFLGACFGKLLYFLLQKRLKFKKVLHLGIITVICGFGIATVAVWDHRVAGPGIEVMSGFLFKEDHADLKLVFVRFFGTLLSYLSGAAGGIFSPSLAIGGTIGSYLTGFFGADHSNLMVLLGMIGFLTGVTRTPFTSFILVLEMTDRHLAIFPMMLAALAAQWVAKSIEERSFYENVKFNYMPRRPASASI